MYKYVDPVISIIVPVHNSFSCLASCMESLITQKFREIEIICVDDGSDDGSELILQGYEAKDRRVRVFTQARAGTGMARNAGISHARGTYLMFCDSGDFYAPQMCKKMYTGMKKSGADIGACGALCVTQGMIYPERARRKPPEYGKHPLTNYWKEALAGTIGDKIFKKAVVNAQQISFPPVMAAGNLSFLAQYMAVTAHCYTMRDELYYHVQRPDSILSQLKRKGIFPQEIINSFRYTLDFLSRRNLIKENLFLLFRLEDEIQTVFHECGDDFTGFYRELREAVLCYYSHEDLAGHPILKAVQKGNDRNIRELLEDRYAAQTRGLTPVKQG
jgi:glycosyltransferase involved in cell wall biosynthesis